MYFLKDIESLATLKMNKIVIDQETGRGLVESILTTLCLIGFLEHSPDADFSMTN